MANPSGSKLKFGPANGEWIDSTEEQHKSRRTVAQFDWVQGITDLVKFDPAIRVQFGQPQRVQVKFGPANGEWIDSTEEQHKSPRTVAQFEWIDSTEEQHKSCRTVAQFDWVQVITDLVK